MRKALRPDHVLVFSVFVVASSGLAYELVSAALASYLLGDSVLQFSTVIGCYLFAMGVGSHLSRFVRDADLLRVFIEVELLIALVGGLSASVLFVLFGAQGLPFRTLLYALVFCIGVLVGSEIPLVMRLLDARKRETGLALGDMLSRVLTFDYLGALIVSLLFPLLLAPWLGMARTALMFGLLNALVALYTLHAFRAELAVRGLLLRALAVILLLAAAMAGSGSLTGWSEQRLYGDTIVHAQSTPYQRIVLTRWRDDLRLYLNGELQFSSRDEYRYHEALVHPALEGASPARKVLVLGGGDGLAAREILRYADVASITLVDLDPAVTTLFAQQEELVALNRGALSDARVRVVNADAGQWLEHNADVFDAIIVDLPDPTNFALGKLYSVPFYRLLARRLSAGGLVRSRDARARRLVSQTRCDGDVLDRERVGPCDARTEADVLVRSHDDHGRHIVSQTRRDGDVLDRERVAQSDVQTEADVLVRSRDGRVHHLVNRTRRDVAVLVRERVGRSDAQSAGHGQDRNRRGCGLVRQIVRGDDRRLVHDADQRLVPNVRLVHDRPFPGGRSHRVGVPLHRVLLLQGGLSCRTRVEDHFHLEDHLPAGGQPPVRVLVWRLHHVHDPAFPGDQIHHVADRLRREAPLPVGVPCQAHVVDHFHREGHLPAGGQPLVHGLVRRRYPWGGQGL